jgi:hypothetical protein
MKTFEPKSFISNGGLLIDCNVTIIIEVGNGLNTIMVCNVIICMDFSKIWALGCNSK